jgi:hypothetical protein
MDILSIINTIAQLVGAEPAQVNSMKTSDSANSISESVAKFFGGPLDGATEVLDNLVPSVVIPYYADAEEDRETVVLMGQQVPVPNLAFYQLAPGDDPDYIYRRDISREEFQKLSVQGKMPDF